ncbi:hypothetical protein ACVWWK_003253 [Bradyrhizobium sp. LB9.1b]
MATAVQKITLSSSRDIPFNKLILSQTNVRTRKDGISIEDLAASIARRGLIQSIHVRPVLDADGAETGMFDVPAGGRRYRALELLVKQKRLAKTAPVPCVVGDAKSPILAEEVSLAENIDRLSIEVMFDPRTKRPRNVLENLSNPALKPASPSPQCSEPSSPLVARPLSLRKTMTT